MLKKGYTLAFPSPTNQIFPVLEREKEAELSELIEFSFWENVDQDHVIVRIATSWATQEADVDRLLELM